ncbi:MAG: hypothetical protein M3P83_13950 [Actinomycetota bacterium]|nr:hypothetical protein [Actinomycetota bacterium]
MPDQMRFAAADAERFGARRDQLVAAFSEWLVEPLRKQGCADDFGMLLDWKFQYGDGRLDRWSREELSEFLLAWCPRKVLGAPDLLASIPVATTLGMSFLAAEGLLHRDSEPAEALTEHATNLVPEFTRAITDPSNYGMAKSIFSAMGVDDASQVSTEDLQQLIDDFNALPAEERRAVTDPAMSALDMADATLGPVRMPTEEQVRESAAAAPVLTLFRRLAEYLAPPGKALTAKGNLKIADARALTELLGTADTYEYQIGDTTWRKRSSTEFADLDHVQWWARECGVVRRRHNRLVAVAAWQQRVRRDPVPEVRKAFEVLVDHGVLGPRVPLRTPVSELLDVSVVPLLGRLLQFSGPTPYDELLAACRELMRHTGIEEHYPGQLNALLDLELSMLERGGLLTQHGAEYRAAQFGRDDRFGGAVALTPVGRHLAVAAVRDAGIGVAELPLVQEMTAEDVAGLATVPALAPDDWWADVVAWAGAQPDATAARAELVTALGRLGPLDLLLALETAPDEEQGRLVPVLRGLAGAPPEEGSTLAGLAITWLVQRGLVGPDTFAPEQLLDALVESAAALVADDEALAVEMVAEGRSVDEQLDLVHAVAARGRPASEVLLEALGRHHADKAVSRAARKELFRLHSRRR